VDSISSILEVIRTARKLQGIKERPIRIIRGAKEAFKG
jgi:hypothetical protein